MDIYNKISVLITFYNQEKYVDRALESVFSQLTNFGYKVIIGDDGSTDGTFDKLHSWQEKFPKRLSVIRHYRVDGEECIGGSRASKNRLSLLKKVDTPYFIFLDGDDYWTDPYKLQVQFDILEDEDNKDCVASAHQITLKHEDSVGDIEYIPDGLKDCKLSLREYWSKYYFHTNTILFRSNHILDLRYDVLEETFNDVLITYSFMQFGKMHYIPRNMAVYYQNKNGIWAGGKRIVNVIRSIMSYDVEVKINSEYKSMCAIRHLSDFLFVRNNKRLLSSVDDKYLKVASKYQFKTMENALLGKPLLGNSFFMDRIIILLFKLKERLKDKILLKV